VHAASCGHLTMQEVLQAHTCAGHLSYCALWPTTGSDASSGRHIKCTSGLHAMRAQPGSPGCMCWQVHWHLYRQLRCAPLMLCLVAHW
jgi:hypothetical protein